MHASSAAEAGSSTRSEGLSAAADTSHTGSDNTTLSAAADASHTGSDNTTGTFDESSSSGPSAEGVHSKPECDVSQEEEEEGGALVLQETSVGSLQLMSGHQWAEVSHLWSHV